MVGEWEENLGGSYRKMDGRVVKREKNSKWVDYIGSGRGH